MEGPTGYGLEHPHCSDCSGCNADFLECEIKEPIVNWQQVVDARDSIRFGGYFNVEFCRDVELQTPLFHTTQENVAFYLSNAFNSQSNLKIWQKPICIVSSASHDMTIQNLTTALYVRNVRWYLSFLELQCESLIWIAYTAPATDNYQQKIGLIREWNLAVKNLLATDYILSEKTIFIDVFEASVTSEHKDNIHMRSLWYHRLSNLVGNNLYSDWSSNRTSSEYNASTQG